MKSYYNLRKDTGRQPRTLFQSANYFAVSRPSDLNEIEHGQSVGVKEGAYGVIIFKF